MKNNSLIVVYIIQTQTVSLENIPYFDYIFFVEYHHVSLYTCIYIYFFFLVFIDLKAETFFKRIIFRSKVLLHLRVNILPSDTSKLQCWHMPFSWSVQLQYQVFSHTCGSTFRDEKQHGKIFDMFDLSVHFISIENLTLFILICFVRKANVFSPYA